MQQPLTGDAYRQVLGRFATGVTVVTTRASGHDHAMTANTFTSVSLEPLLVLVCIEQEARFHDAVVEAGVWGISILGADQRPTAHWLATRGRPLHGQLEGIACHRGPATGTVLLDGALASLECRTHQLVPAGDHSIVVGEVVGLDLPDHAGDALTYFRSRFGTIH